MKAAGAEREEDWEGDSGGGGGGEKNQVWLQRVFVCDAVRSGLRVTYFLKEDEDEDLELFVFTAIAAH